MISQKLCLTWSAVVCTLNRRDILKQSLLMLAKQTRLPQQVIVVDASDDWEDSKTEILDSIASDFPEIEWIYLSSEQKSLTYQRNRGLDCCSSDIVFFPDDDSFLYPDCAEEIMRAYEQDEVGKVGGVMARLEDVPPWIERPVAESVGDLEEENEPGLKARLAQFAAQLWYQKKLFIPYDGQYHSYDVSEVAERIPAFNEVLFHGCRMTFRASVVREAGGFDEVLIKSAIAEDIDLSYRVSRHYALIVAEKAQVFHAQTEVARINRYRNTALVILNAVALFLLNAPQTEGKGLKVYRFALSRLLLEFVRDCAKPQRGFPNVRGAWYALRALPKLLRRDRAQLRSWYPQFQAQIYQL